MRSGRVVSNFVPARAAAELGLAGFSSSRLYVGANALKGAAFDGWEVNASYIGAACESNRLRGRRPRISSIERIAETMS